MCQHLQGRTFLLEQRQSTLFVLCKEQEHAGMRLPLSGSINMPCITISQLDGWYICLCVCAPQQEPTAMFWLVEVRDTEGLSLPFLPNVPIFANKIQQDKYGNNTSKHSCHLRHKVIQVTTLLVRADIFTCEDFLQGILFFQYIYFLHLNLEITFM